MNRLQSNLQGAKWIQKNRCLLHLFIGLLVFISLFESNALSESRPDTLPVTASGDLDGDSIPEKVRLVSVPIAGKKQAMLLEISDGSERVLFSQLFPAWHIALGDLDRDGKQEILLGLTRFDEKDNQTANRLYVYNYSGGKLIDRWRGTALAGMFTHFNVVVNDKNEAIVRVWEKEPNDASYFISDYQWTGFGFIRITKNPAGEENDEK